MRVETVAKPSQRQACKYGAKPSGALDGLQPSLGTLAGLWLRRANKAPDKPMPVPCRKTSQELQGRRIFQNSGQKAEGCAEDVACAIGKICAVTPCHTASQNFAAPKTLRSKTRHHYRNGVINSEPLALGRTQRNLKTAIASRSLKPSIEGARAGFADFSFLPRTGEPLARMRVHASAARPKSAQVQGLQE